MATGPKARVNGPPALPPFHSLLKSFDVTNDADGRWVNGLRFTPERCEGGGTLDPCGPSDKTLSQDDNRDNVEYEPFVVWTGAICNTLDPEYGVREGQARARRLLAACESAHAASEFWQGTLAIAKGWPNFYLRKAGAIILSDLGGDGVSPEDALACLEQAIAECSCSAHGVIHTTRQVLTHWVAANLVTVSDSGRIRTYLGTPVVADSGYTGNAPADLPDDAGVVWAYATGQIQIRIGPILDIPARDSISQGVDRETNDAIWRVERPVAITTDGCCHAAIGISVTQCQSLQFAS